MLLLSLLLHDPLIPEGGHLVSLTHPAQFGGCVTRLVGGGSGWTGGEEALSLGSVGRVS